METYENLRKEFENKVKSLQRKCKHKKISEWMMECWAIAHSTGYEVKLCKICNKRIKRRKIKSYMYSKSIKMRLKKYEKRLENEAKNKFKETPK